MVLVRRFFISILVGILILTPSRSNSQVKTEKSGFDPYDLSLEELGKITITASKTPQATSKVTQRVDVVTEQQFSNIFSLNRNIAELIQYLPGAAVKVLSRNDVNWGAYGGLGPKYVTWMVQGLGVDGFIDPMTINILGIRRIEVQRGPASILYPNFLSQDFAGNQSPLAGTINIILKDYVTEPRTLLSVRYGTFSTLTAQGYHENRFGPLSMYGGVLYERSDYTDYGASGSWLHMLKNPEYDKERMFIGGSLYLDSDEKHKLTAYGNLTLHAGDVGRVNRKFDHKYGLINAGYSGQLTDDCILTGRVGLRSYDRSWQEDNYIYGAAVPDLSLKEKDGVEQVIVPADISISWRHLDGSVLTAGADYQGASYKTWTEPAGGIRSDRNDAFVSQLGLYMQEELQMEKLTIRGGARFNAIGCNIDKIDARIPGEEKKSWSIVLWSLGAKYRFSETLDIYANAGSSFMSPGLKSIGGTLPASARNQPGANGQLPNPDLRPENGIGIDAGADVSLAGGMNLTVRTFFNLLYDAIMESIVSENPSQSMSINADGKTTVFGVEVECRQKLSHSISVFGNITLAKSNVEDPEDPDKDGVELPFLPAVTGNAGLTFVLPGDINIDAYAHFGGSIYDGNSRRDRKSFTSREVINAVLSRFFELSGDLRVFTLLRFYNITNNRYEMPWQFRDPGFAIEMTAGVTF
jgi:outer membrane receptor protein involved in Fe transport